MRAISSKSRRSGLRGCVKYSASVPSMRPSDARISVDQQPRRPAARAGCAQVLPQRVARDLGDDDLALQVDRRGAGAVARPDFELGASRERSSAGRRGPAHVLQHVGFRVVDRDRAQRVGRDALGRLGDRFERCGQVDVAGDALEHAPLAGGQQLAALALGDVGDAAADQAAAGGGQPDQAHFAGNVVAERIAMHPFEDRRFAGQRAVEVPAHDAERRRAVRLVRRAHAFGPIGEQLLARHLEEAHGVLVALDEAAGVHVEDDDGFGRVLDQRAVARLAFAHRGLRRPCVRSCRACRRRRTSRRSSRILLTPISAANRLPFWCRPLVSRGSRSACVSSTRLGQFLERLDDARPARRATESAGRACGRGVGSV